MIFRITDEIAQNCGFAEGVYLIGEGSYTIESDRTYELMEEIEEYIEGGGGGIETVYAYVKSEPMHFVCSYEVITVETLKDTYSLWYEEILWADQLEMFRVCFDDAVNGVS